VHVCTIVKQLLNNKKATLKKKTIDLVQIAESYLLSSHLKYSFRNNWFGLTHHPNNL